MDTNGDDYSPEDRAEAAKLDPARIAMIDAEIIKATTPTWLKVAYVVGTVMAEIRVPDLFVAERVREMVSKGILESRGYLGRMHYSEVRLAQ